MTHFVGVEACWHEVQSGTGTARERGEERVQPATHRKTVTHTHTTPAQLWKETNPSEFRQNTQFRKNNSSQREMAHISSEKTNSHGCLNIRLKYQ